MHYYVQPIQYDNSVQPAFPRNAVDVTSWRLGWTDLIRISISKHRSDLQPLISPGKCPTARVQPKRLRPVCGFTTPCPVSLDQQDQEPQDPLKPRSVATKLATDLLSSAEHSRCLGRTARGESLLLVSYINRLLASERPIFSCSKYTLARAVRTAAG